MANSNRGEVALVIDGKTWTLRYSVNALASLEDRLDKGVQEIGALLSDAEHPPRMRTLLAIVACGLMDRHPEVDDALASEIMTAGGIAAVMAKVGEAFALAFGGGGDDPARPQTGAQPGAGARS